MKKKKTEEIESCGGCPRVKNFDMWLLNARASGAARFFSVVKTTRARHLSSGRLSSSLTCGAEGQVTAIKLESVEARVLSRLCSMDT